MTPIQSLPAPIRVTSMQARQVAQDVTPQTGQVSHEDHRDVRLGAADAAMAAALAARAVYDPRETGPTHTVTSFDRMELVIEGFEHLREIFARIREQAAEDFGPLAAEKSGGEEFALPAALLDTRV